MVHPAPPATADPLVSACVRLGWQMEELFSQLAVPDGPPAAGDRTRLPGLSKLSSYDLHCLGLDEVDFVMDQVWAKVKAPPAQAGPLTGDARSKLQATIQAADGAAQRSTEYRESLAELHRSLLITLAAAESFYGKAYGLGRALADTTRPGQAPAELGESFQRNRIGELYVWLNDLASLLPPHSAHAVAQSLTWWQQAVTAAVAGGKLSGNNLPASYPGSTTLPLWKQVAELKPRSRGPQPANTTPPPADRLAVAVTRQGTQWRRVLDGEKLCTDLLTAQDYMRAGERLARQWAGLAVRMVRTMPWILLLLVLVLAAVVLVLVFIPGSAVARTATAAAAIAGTFSAIWKLIQSRLGAIANQLSQPLWGAELNKAAAEAITVPPMGAARDPAWEPAFEQAATRVVTAGQLASPVTGAGAGEPAAAGP